MAITLYARHTIKDDAGNIIGLYLRKAAQPEDRFIPVRRDYIISELQGDDPNWQIFTTYEDSDGNLKKGAQIHVVEGRYLRTDPTPIEADNLDELPEHPQEVVVFRYPDSLYRE